MDFIELCRKFIEADSTPDNGTVEIARLAADLCRERGLHVQLQAETHKGVEQGNVIARPQEAMPDDELLLQTHLDTCDPGNYALWTRTGANPFNASIYQDTMFGLGSARSKLDFLCKLQAIDELKGSAWKKPFALVGTFGEEQGMTGAMKLIRKKMIQAKTALIGEPTDMKIVAACKGYAGVEIEIPFSEEERTFRAQHDLSDGSTTQSRVFVGKAAHSTMPQLGDSAILKMLDYLDKLPEGLALMEIEGGISYNTVPANAVIEIDMVGGLKDSMATKISRIIRKISEIEKRFLEYPDHEFVPPEPTLNIGLIRTGKDSVKMGGSCRLPPTVTDEVYEGWMESFRNACQDVGAAFRITDHKRPFRTNTDAPLFKICRDQLAAQGLRHENEATYSTLAIANEANIFSRFGISCVVIGPGVGVGNTYAPNEHVRIEQLQQAVRFYRGVLERTCL